VRRVSAHCVLQPKQGNESGGRKTLVWDFILYMYAIDDSFTI